MTEHPDQTSIDREERIRRLAYRLWEEDGQPEGKSEEHWHKASALVFAEENGLKAPDWLKKIDALPASSQADPKRSVQGENPAVLRRAKAM